MIHPAVSDQAISETPARQKVRDLIIVGGKPVAFLFHERAYELPVIPLIPENVSPVRFPRPSELSEFPRGHTFGNPDMQAAPPNAHRIVQGSRFAVRGEVRRFDEAQGMREPEDPRTQGGKGKGGKGEEQPRLVLRIQAACRLR